MVADVPSIFVRSQCLARVRRFCDFGEDLRSFRELRLIGRAALGLTLPMLREVCRYVPADFSMPARRHD
jgi:hypothetical protein